ncbi:hypothetical protein ABT093_32305 [Kitasatospora sp. NPDC002551]|uniref:hypothetical protein n=1 Tax=unclassified Kitasatospora TaxID=2633591 RepID=UPI0033238141
MTDRTHDSAPVTDREEHHLVAGLTALADSPAPASRLDTGWAIRAGRSRLRRRRAGVLGAVAAVVLGASVVAAALPFGDPRPPDAAATGLAGAEPALPRFGPDTGRTPMVVDTTFGWLPTGFDQYAYNSGPTTAPWKLSIKAIGARVSPDNPNRKLIFLSVYGASEQPPAAGAVPNVEWHLIDTAPVNGQPAYWRGIGPDTPTGLGGQRILVFRLPDGRWAELTAAYMDADPVAELLSRIAAGVRTGPQAAAMPFTLRDVPADAVPDGGAFNIGVDSTMGYAWEASVSYKLGNGYIAVIARPDAEPDPAYKRRPLTSGEEEVPRACKTERGLHVCAMSSQGDEPFAAVGGLQGWLDRVTPLGTDPAGWTRDVVR